MHNKQTKHMENLKTLNKWANAHSYYPIDILRILLGSFLFYKGVYFMSNLHALVDLYAPLQTYADGMIIVHYIASAHFVGGSLIVFGLLTRWAITAQLPILTGAILVNFLGDLDTVNLSLSILVIALCLFFLFFGSGKHSVDYYLKMQQ